MSATLSSTLLLEHVDRASQLSVPLKERFAHVQAILAVVRSGEIRDLEEEGFFQEQRLYEGLAGLCTAIWRYGTTAPQGETVIKPFHASLGRPRMMNRSHIPVGAGMMTKAPFGAGGAGVVNSHVHAIRQNLPPSSFPHNKQQPQQPNLLRDTLDATMELLQRFLKLPEISVGVLCGLTPCPATPLIREKCLDVSNRRFGPSFVRAVLERLRARKTQRPVPRQHQQQPSLAARMAAGQRGQAPAPVDPEQVKETRDLVSLLYQLYVRVVPLRGVILQAIHNVVDDYTQCDTHTRGIPELIQLIAAIIRGLQTPVSARHGRIFVELLLALHRPNSKLGDRDPTISVYHSQLVGAVEDLLSKAPSLTVPMLRGVLRIWPGMRDANTVKEVFLMHELERLVSFCSPLAFQQLKPSIFAKVITGITSPNARASQKALSMFRNERFLHLVMDDVSERAATLELIFPLLVGELHWNDTVNKMRGSLLLLFRRLDAPLFTACAARSPPPPPHKDDILAFIREQLKVETEEKTEEERQALLLESAERERELIARVEEKVRHANYYDFVFGHDLGKGSYSTVRYAKLILRGEAASAWKEFAVKIVSKKVLAAQSYQQNLKQEIRVMQALRGHPNITQFYQTCESEDSVFVVMDYAAKGDLQRQLSQFGSLTAVSTQFLLAEVLSALQAIHSCGLLYRDLKPENILFRVDNHALLADFGSVCAIGEEKEGGARLEGTAEYLAPELIEHGVNATSTASDVWAFGCLLFQCLAGRPPVWTEESQDVQLAQRDIFAKIVSFKILDDDKTTSEQEEDELFPPDFPSDAKDLVSLLLERDPVQRATLDEAKQHAFFAGIDWGTLASQDPPALAAGIVAPQPDKAWARRRNSMIFAPMPEDYSLSSSSPYADILEQRQEEEMYFAYCDTVSSGSGSGSNNNKSSSGRPPVRPVIRHSSRFRTVRSRSNLRIKEEEEQEEEEEEEDEEGK